jgi:hypothetical protein
MSLKGKAKRDYMRSYGKKWREKYPEKAKLKSQKDGKRLTSIFARYRNRAKYKSLPFEFSLRTFEETIKISCFYCGDVGSPYNGLDRRDNESGYTVKNCVPCCSKCNQMKNTYSVEQFLSKCKKIVKYLNY